MRNAIHNKSTECSTSIKCLVRRAGTILYPAGIYTTDGGDLTLVPAQDQPLAQPDLTRDGAFGREIPKVGWATLV